MDLVIGGSGFLGETLVKRLLKDGKKIRIFDITPPNLRGNKNIEFIKGDVSDYVAVEKAIKECRVVYNTASLLPCSQAGEGFTKTNVLGTDNILKAAEKLGINKVVHISSSIVYGVPKNLNIKETEVVAPVGRYGKSKLEAEKLCLEYIDKGVNIVILRPRFIVGPGRLGLLTILFEWIKENKNIYTIGNGKNIFQMVGVDDLVDVIVAASKVNTNGIYNIGAESLPTVNDILGDLVKHANSQSKIVHIPSFIARPALYLLGSLKVSPLGTEHFLIADKNYQLDISKAKSDFNWKPKQNPSEMMKLAYDWYWLNKNSLDKTNLSSFPKELALKIVKKFS